MTQLRDEAHRSRSRTTASVAASGRCTASSTMSRVWVRRSKALLQAFGSVAAIAAASEAALTAIKGVGPALARKIREAVGRA